MVTMEDIAKRLGVTKGTVSKAMNGAEDVSESLRKTVLETAVEMGYTRIARRGKSKSVCVFVTNMEYEKPEDFGAELILGFRQMAEPVGFAVTVVPLNPETQARYSYDEYMLKNRYEGAFLLGLSFKDPWMEDFKVCRTPAVLYDSPVFMNPVVTSISINNFEGMSLAAAWLKSLGHRRIGYLGGALGSYIYQVRYAAFFNAMKENGLELDETMTGVAYYASDCLKQHFQRIIDLGCTAIICSHDLLAHAVMIHCNECGLRVPDDLSVIGVDDIPLCRHTTPPLSSIRQNRLDLGRSAFYALSSQLAKIPVSTLTLHAELIRRASVAPPTARQILTETMETVKRPVENTSRDSFNQTT